MVPSASYDLFEESLWRLYALLDDVLQERQFIREGRPPREDRGLYVLHPWRRDNLANLFRWWWRNMAQADKVASCGVVRGGCSVRIWNWNESGGRLTCRSSIPLSLSHCLASTPKPTTASRPPAQDSSEQTLPFHHPLLSFPHLLPSPLSIFKRR
jgi:hypothetical protein